MIFLNLQDIYQIANKPINHYKCWKVNYTALEAITFYDKWCTGNWRPTCPGGKNRSKDKKASIRYEILSSFSWILQSSSHLLHKIMILIMILAWCRTWRFMFIGLLHPAWCMMKNENWWKSFKSKCITRSSATMFHIVDCTCDGDNYIRKVCLLMITKRCLKINAFL